MAHPGLPSDDQGDGLSTELRGWTLPTARTKQMSDLIKLVFVLDIGKLARRQARNQAAKPGRTRKIEDKRHKSPKHKKQMRLED
jgi:hypothetical protein